MSAPLIIALVVLGYFLLGTSTAIVTRVLTDADTTNAECVWVGIFWPITWLCALFLAIVFGCVITCEKIGKCLQGPAKMLNPAAFIGRFADEATQRGLEERKDRNRRR